MTTELATRRVTAPGVHMPANGRLARLGRAACVVVGLALGIYLVQGAGLARVAEVLRAAGVWIPVLVAIELAVIAVDLLAARALLLRHPVDGEPEPAFLRPPTFATWLRSSALANACSVFLPAGRAAGEGARAATLAPAYGTARVVAAFARLQVCSLAGTAAASLVLAALVAWLVPGPSVLAPLLLGNALVCAALAGGIFVVARNRRLAAWLGRLRARFSSTQRDARAEKPLVDAAPSRAATVRALAFCTLGRTIQAVQYGVAVLAVGGVFTLRSAVTADGIHLVGASVGDLMPNQVGAMEAAYAWFAEPLGFADAPARALSIAVVMHGVQVGVALVGLVLANAVPRGHAS